MAKFLVAATKILFVVPNFVAVTQTFFPWFNQNILTFDSVATGTVTKISCERFHNAVAAARRSITMYQLAFADTSF